MSRPVAEAAQNNQSILTDTNSSATISSSDAELKQKERKEGLSLIAKKTLVPHIDNVLGELKQIHDDSKLRSDNARSLSKLRSRLNMLSPYENHDFSDKRFQKLTEKQVKELATFAQTNNIERPQGAQSIWSRADIRNLVSKVSDYIDAQAGQEMTQSQATALQKAESSCSEISQHDKDFTTVQALFDAADSLGVTMPASWTNGKKYVVSMSELHGILENIKLNIEDLNSQKDSQIMEIQNLQKNYQLLQQILSKIFEIDHQLNTNFVRGAGGAR